MKSKELCSGCGKPRVIQNREYQLCRECNNQRLQGDGSHDIYAGMGIAEINQVRNNNGAGDMKLGAPLLKMHVKSTEDGGFVIIDQTEEHAKIPLEPEKPETGKTAWTNSDYESLGKKIAELLIKSQKPVRKEPVLFKCPECSTPLNAGQPFCSNCGSEMEWKK